MNRSNSARGLPHAAARTLPTRYGAWLAACAGMAAWLGAAQAADHREAPLTLGDPAADIADVYVWHDNGKLFTVVTVDGIKPPASGQAGTFDPDVLYTVNIDNSGDHVADIAVLARFATTPSGKTFVVVLNLPGSAGPVIGPVERVVRRGDTRVFAGLRDDPFFFDLEGFRQTLSTGTLSFVGTRDTFKGTNATALVFEMDLDAALGGGSSLEIWATTARAGAGQ